MAFQTQQNTVNIFYLWLLPDYPAFDLLQKKIADLARIYSLPSFPPHVTLISVTASAREIEKKLQAHFIPKIELRTTPPKSSSHFFKSIFLPVHPVQQLTSIHHQLSQSFGQPPKPDYNPHLSLLYGDHSHGRRMDIIRNMNTEEQAFTCSRIALVAGGKKVEQWNLLNVLQLPNREEQ